MLAPEMVNKDEDLFQLYSNIVWDVFLSTTEKTVSALGRHGEKYDNKLKGQLDGIELVVREFYRMGVVAPNPEINNQIKGILKAAEF